jgi:pimeloyl-ACP methyl ester carboxylesterase
LLHVADPLTPSLALISAIAERRAPAIRVMSLTPGDDAPYQVAVADLHGVCQQFGFAHAELAGEGLGCVVATLYAAWFPSQVTRLTLYAPAYRSDSESLFGRSLRDCPPDWPSLRRAITCPVDERG